MYKANYFPLTNDAHEAISGYPANVTYKVIEGQKYYIKMKNSDMDNTETTFEFTLSADDMNTSGHPVGLSNGLSSNIDYRN